MDELRVSLGYSKEPGGGERIILCLSYGRVVQAQSNHNIMFEVVHFFVIMFKVQKFSNIGVLCSFMVVVFLCERGT